MTRDELFKGLWNSYSSYHDCNYRQWVKLGFDWMFGWHESELKSLKIELGDLQRRFDKVYEMNLSYQLAETDNDLQGQVTKLKEILNNLVGDIETPSRLGLGKPPNPEWRALNEARLTLKELYPGEYEE